MDPTNLFTAQFPTSLNTSQSLLNFPMTLTQACLWRKQSRNWSSGKVSFWWLVQCLSDGLSQWLHGPGEDSSQWANCYMYHQVGIKIVVSQPFRFLLCSWNLVSSSASLSDVFGDSENDDLPPPYIAFGVNVAPPEEGPPTIPLVDAIVEDESTLSFDEWPK